MKHYYRATFLALFSLCHCATASAQITAEFIASSISKDSGNPSAQYLEYGKNLARTLRLLTPAQLARVFGENTTVIVPDTLNELLEMGDVNFAPGSPDLSPSALAELDKVVEYLSLNTTARIEIEGHAWYHNARSQPLSEQRAMAAMNYLVSMGIDPDRIKTVGYGADRPLVDDPDRTKTEANRRIEIKVQ